MSMLGTKTPKFTDGRTKQSFKDETDINKILKRAQKSGTISHLNQYQSRYGDFSGFDFFEAQLKLSQGGEIFDALPVEIKREFNQSPAQFFEFVNDPANADRVQKLLPALAEPGRQYINPKGNQTADEARASETAEKAVEAKSEAPVEPQPEAEPPSTATT